jgi:hypothetical protein
MFIAHFRQPHQPKLQLPAYSLPPESSIRARSLS